jgi:hypothetical protein
MVPTASIYPVLHHSDLHLGHFYLRFNDVWQAPVFESVRRLFHRGRDGSNGKTCANDACWLCPPTFETGGKEFIE